HDLYATICEVAKVPLPAGVDAKSLTPILRREMDVVRDSLFLPFQDNQRAVSDGRWKLHIYPQINYRLLFDLENDPHEMTNLAGEPEHEEVEKRMEDLMEVWRTELGDPYPLSVAEPEEKMPVFHNETRVLDRWQPEWIRDKYFEGRSDVNQGKKK
ncbi:MAG: sulfatase/phosphatase domain-containing protein, partial [Verrucomicrobiota bacterium]